MGKVGLLRSDCLYVCLSASLSLRSHISTTTWQMSRHFQHILPMAVVRFGPPTTKTQYVQYFRFCGWRHVFIIIARILWLGNNSRRPATRHSRAISSVVWSPYLKLDIERLENVQRLFRKRLVGLKHVEYAERLQRLNLHSLELRRLRTDLIWCYKIVFGLVRLSFGDFFK